MSPLLAHAGEETLYVLVPVLVVVALVLFGKRRDDSDEQSDEQSPA